MNLAEKIKTCELSDRQVGIFYLGQVGYLFKFREKILLIDPYLTDYVDRNCCSETVKWVRLYPAPITGKELPFADYVCFTHAHADHMDPDTVKEILSVNPKALFIAAAPLKKNLIEIGVPETRILGVKTDMDYVLDTEKEIRFRAIPSAHEELHPDGEGSYYEVGYRLDFGGMTFYHCGDCSVYEGLAEKIGQADVCFLTINGRDYFRNANDIIGCMNSMEALRLSEAVKADLLIPTHFDLYAVNEVNPAYFVDCQRRYMPGLKTHLFIPGEGMIYQKGL